VDIHLMPPSGLGSVRERESGREGPQDAILLVERDEASGKEEVNVEGDHEEAHEPEDLWPVLLIQELHCVPGMGQEEEKKGD
jgi:hypothetical protein